jgi:periplasmic copper chaperone A
MKRLPIVVLLGISLLGACTTATGIEIGKAWARPAKQGENGVIYFLLQNHSASADELTGITTAVVEAVQIHETTMDGDIMRMRPFTSISIPGKTSLEFETGGKHVMLLKLNKELKPGEEVQVTFQFKNHEYITLNIPVLEYGDTSMSGH